MTRYALDTQNNLIKGIPYSDQKLLTNVQFQSFVFNIPPPQKKGQHSKFKWANISDIETNGRTNGRVKTLSLSLLLWI